MASYPQILGILAEKTGPVSPAEIAKDLAVKVNEVATPLKRMVEKKPPLVEMNEEGNYTITEDGKKELNPITEESEQVTESQVFMNYGLKIGVPKDLVGLTQEHIWNGGDWKNLNWVKKGLIEMNIKGDLLGRWLGVWRTYLTRGIEAGDVEAALERGVVAEKPIKPADSKEAEAGTGRLRDYILDAANNPIYVGEGMGDMEYALAEKLSILRASAAARAPAPVVGANGGEKHTQISDATELLKAVQELSGGNGAKKSIMMVPNEAGGFTMQEIEPGSTITMPQALSPGSLTAPKSYWYNPKTKQMEEMNPLMPIVIEAAPQAPLNPGQKIFIVEDGVMREHDPSMPVVLHNKPKESDPPRGGMFTIPIGTDGKQSAALSLNDLQAWLDTTFKIQDHQARVERENDSHNNKMELMKTFKEFGVKGVRALGNMAGNNEEESEE